MTIHVTAGGAIVDSHGEAAVRPQERSECSMTHGRSARLLSGPRVGCEPCGMPLAVEGVRAYSAQWYRLHKERHLKAFPRVSRRTIQALNDCIDWAVKQEKVA